MGGEPRHGLGASSCAVRVISHRAHTSVLKSKMWLSTRLSIAANPFTAFL